MSDAPIPFLDPHFPSGTEIARAHDEIVASNWFTNHGPREREFATAVGRFVGDGVHASIVANATSGLMLALRALLGAPDGARREVLVQSFTFAASAEAILWAGHEPVFLDLDPATWQADVTQAERYVEEHPDRVAGILLCNTFGAGTADIDRWEALAASSGVPLVIDSAAGFGSEYPGGERLGGRGACEVFSFHATKPFAVGEGGAVTSRDPELIATVDRLQNFGFDADRQAGMLGLNAKLAELPAAIGLLQLRGFEERLARRRELLAHYVAHLGDAETLPGGERSTVPFVSVRLPDGVDRADVLARLAAGRVEARSYYDPPLHVQPLFAKCAAAGDLAVTVDLSRRVVSLPMSERLTPQAVERVAAIVRGAS